MRKIVITTEDMDDYRHVRLPKGVETRHRDELMKVQEEQVWSHRLWRATYTS